MITPDQARRTVFIEEDLYPMGIIIPDRAVRKSVIVNDLRTGVTGKIIWDGYIYQPNGHFQSGWV